MSGSPPTRNQLMMIRCLLLSSSGKSAFFAIGAPFFAVAIKALGMKGEMEKQGFYPDSLMVRCVIDHPVKVVAAMGIIQILGALAIGMLA